MRMVRAFSAIGCASLVTLLIAKANPGPPTHSVIFHQQLQIFDGRKLIRLEDG